MESSLEASLTACSAARMCPISFLGGSVSIYGWKHLTAMEVFPYMDESVSIYGRKRPTATEASPYMDGSVS